MYTYRKQFGSILRHSRESKNYTRETLAELCDISDRCISNIERGVSEPKLGTAIKLCTACGIDIGTLGTLITEEEMALV